MEVYAKRSLSGLIQLWITIVLPPILILVYFIVIRFDFSQVESAYWIVGSVLLLASILYLLVFGKTLFLPDKVIQGKDSHLIVSTRKNHPEDVLFTDIVDMIAIKNGRMSFLRLSTTNRSYGKLTIKTMQKTYQLYPIANIDEVKKRLEKAIHSKRL